MIKIDHCIIYITKKCNLRCTYCFVQNKIKEQNSMKILTAKKAIDFLFGKISKKKIHLSFFGGEPLIEYQLLKNIVHYAENTSQSMNKSITFSVVTNGILIDEKKLSFFNKHGIKIILSCDGDRESQNKHRVFPDGTGTFDILNKKIAAIARLRNSCARITFTSDTINKIFNNVLYLYNVGFKNIGCSPVDQKDWTGREIKIIERELKKVGEFWLQKHKSGEEIYIRPLIDYFELIENPNQNFRIHMHKCWAGKWGFAIDVNGEIYPCHRFMEIKDFVLGDVFEGKINNNLRRKCFYEKPINSVGCMGINYQFCHDIKKTPPGPLKVRNVFLKVAQEIYRKL